MTNDKPSVSDIHTGAPASSREVEQPKKSQVVATRRRKPQAPLGGLPPEQRSGASEKLSIRETILEARLGALPPRAPLSAAAIEHLAALGGRTLEGPAASALQLSAARKLLARQQYAAKRDGKCPAIVKERNTSWPNEPKKRCCGAVATRMGLCRRHYNKKFLHIRTNQAGGLWGNTRHFAEWQLPGNMSDKQHECLMALPLATAYEDCIAAMNSADPANILTPIYEKPASRKSKSCE